MKRLSVLSLVLVLGMASLAFADVASVEANNNATIQPAGPRPGASGKAFFNIEGSANGNFASYGVARWDVSAAFAQFDVTYGAGNWTIDLVQLELTQANAAFSTTGDVRIGHTDDDTSDIEPGTSPHTYPIAGDFADLTTVLDYTYTVIASGTVDSYTLYDSLGVNSAGGLALLADLTNESTVTLTLEELQADVAATYAGYTNSSFAGPTLVITATPEPGTIGLLAIGVLAMVRRRTR